jgi:hypothetical protein
VGHVEGIHDEFGPVMVGHGIADDLAGGQVRPAGEVEPALGRRKESDVSDQLRAGDVGVEVAAGQVRSRPGFLVRPRQRPATATVGALDAVLTHQAGDALVDHLVLLPLEPQVPVSRCPRSRGSFIH